MYKFLRFLCKIVCKIFVFVKIENREKMLAEGPCLVTSNHESAFDVVSITLKSGRKIHWMAKNQVFKFKPIGALLRYLGAYGVNRNGHDVAAVSETERLLESGEAVGIFAQGTRSRGKGREVKAKHGVVKFAVRQDCPIVPVAVVGKAGLFRHVKIIFMDPITIPQGTYTNEQYTEIAQRILDGIYDVVEAEMKNGNYKS